MPNIKHRCLDFVRIQSWSKYSEQFNDRNINGRHGGGVLMYIAENLAFQHRTELQNNNYQHIWADVRINNNLISINGLYRPPNESAEDHQHFLQTAEDILQQLSNYEKVDYKLLSGDLNFGNCYCRVPILNPNQLTLPHLTFFQVMDFINW